MKCKSCRLRATHGFKFNDPIFCRKHALDGYVAVSKKCSILDCSNAAAENTCHIHTAKPTFEHQVAASPQPSIGETPQITVLNTGHKSIDVKSEPAKNGEIDISKIEDLISETKTNAKANLVTHDGKPDRRLRIISALNELISRETPIGERFLKKHLDQIISSNDILDAMVEILDCRSNSFDIMTVSTEKMNNLLEYIRKFEEGSLSTRDAKAKIEDIKTASLPIDMNLTHPIVTNQPTVDPRVVVHDGPLIHVDGQAKSATSEAEFMTKISDQMLSIKHAVDKLGDQKAVTDQVMKLMMERAARTDDAIIQMLTLLDKHSAIVTKLSSTDYTDRLREILEQDRKAARDFRPSEIYVNVLATPRGIINMTASADHPDVHNIRGRLPECNSETVAKMMSTIGFRQVKQQVSNWKEYYRMKECGKQPVNDLVYDTMFVKSL